MRGVWSNPCGFESRPEHHVEGQVKSLSFFFAMCKRKGRHERPEIETRVSISYDHKARAYDRRMTNFLETDETAEADRTGEIWPLLGGLSGHLTIIVPVPSSVKTSARMPFRDEPPMTCADLTPRSIREIRFSSFGIMPPVARPFEIISRAS